jgi:hypothetical protein
MVGFLLEKGADPRLRALKNETAITLAQGENKEKIIKLISEAIEKKNQNPILKKYESAISSEEQKEIRGKSTDSSPNFLVENTEGRSIKPDSKKNWDGNEKVFDFGEIRQADLINSRLKETGQDFDSQNPGLRGGKVTPSTTIESGTATLFAVVGALIAKFFVGKFKPSKDLKPKNVKKVEGTKEENHHKAL